MADGECWVIEGRWVIGDDTTWDVILGRGPYPSRSEARATALMLAGEAGGGHLYRAVKYSRSPSPKRRRRG